MLLAKCQPAVTFSVYAAVVVRMLWEKRLSSWLGLPWSASVAHADLLWCTTVKFLGNMPARNDISLGMHGGATLIRRFGLP